MLCNLFKLGRFLAIAAICILGISPSFVYAQAPIESDPRLFNLPEAATELTGKRTQDSKTFALPNNQYVAVFRSNLHAKSNAGKWVNPNPRFEAAEDTDVKAKIKGKALRLTGLNQEWIEFALPAVPTVAGVTAFYVGPTGLTWVYIKSNRGVKLQALVGTARGAQSYAFPITTSSPLRLLPNGSVAGNGFHLPPAEVIDNTGRRLVFPWTLNAGALSFAFDDSSLALPYTIDPTTTFSITAGGNDGKTEDLTGDAAYANVACDTAATGVTQDTTLRSFSGGLYNIADLHFRWDTSSLPDAAPITAASLRLWGVAKVDTNARNLVADWNDFGAGLTCADWVHDSLNDAITGVTIASLATGANNTLSLSNLSNLNRTGFTGIRLHVDGGVPGGVNEFSIAMFDDPALDEPQLSVTYNAGIVMIAPGISSGYHTIRVTHGTTGAAVYVDNVLQASAVVVDPIGNNANNWSMFVNTVMPYVDFAKITVGGTQRLWFQMNDLPDHQIDDRSGNGNNATARYPDTPSGITSSVLPLEPTGVTFGDVVASSGDFVAPVSEITNLTATEHLNTPTFLPFVLLKWGADNSGGMIPYQAYLIMFAFVLCVAAMLGSWYALHSVHITWIALTAASISFIFVGGGIWTWMIPFSVAITGAVYIFWRRGAI